MIFPRCFGWLSSAKVNEINGLLAEYLSADRLNECLADLPRQFGRQKIRPWSKIDWRKIDASQVVDLDLDVFLTIVRGALDTEAPISEYTNTSRQYLAPIHPQMAEFVGGDGKNLGLWELEEKRHTPALRQIYRRLSGVNILPQSREVSSYEPTADAADDLFRHGLHRIGTECGATCLYLWLMAHTRGELRAVLGEILIDEINHTAKFWGFGLWLFGNEKSWRSLPILFLNRNRNSRGLPATIKRTLSVLGWSRWTVAQKLSAIYTGIAAMLIFLHWQATLTEDLLQNLLNRDPVSLQPS
jgi:hypothetical protein